MKNKKYFIITSLLLTLGISLIFITTKSYFSSNTNNKVIISKNNKNSNKNIIAFKVEQDDGSYKEQTDVPGSAYVFNQEKSTCTNGVTPKWEDSGIFLDNITSSGTSCYLTFDIAPTSEDTLAKLNITNVNNSTPTFSNAATTNEGIYAMADGMYGGTSYYWRGVATTNHVIFANKCWRIVRINGDGTMRLIYNGAVQTGNKCTGNGSNSESIAVSSQAYNPSYDRSEYVGYTYSTGSQRTTSGSPSNLKSQTDSWYTTNIKNPGFEGKVADGKFCNDRDTGSGYSWSSQPSSTFYYAGYDRRNGSPTLSCPSGDVYTLKAGAITMDEVVMAGAKWGTANSSYYLCNGQYYWTMSPFSTWSNGSLYQANVIRVNGVGQLDYSNVHDTSYGVRPVINLKADILFNSGSNGTQDNPYIVQ